MEELKERLLAFKKKYYLRQLAIGGGLFLIIGIGAFLLLATIEYQFWLNTTARTILFFTFLLLVLGLLFYGVVRPLLKWTALTKGLSDEEASREISSQLDEIDDKLINTLQLSGQQASQQNALLNAAIDKKVEELRIFNFKSAINFDKAKRFAAIVLILVGGLFLVSFINPTFISSSSERIINYNKEYVPEAPFQFDVTSKLQAFKGRDYQFSFQLNGENIPEKAYIIVDDILKREVSGNQSGYAYQFQNIQENKRIQLEAAGFKSITYEIEVIERPALVEMLIEVVPPSYTKAERQTIANRGDITVPNGSKVNWTLSTNAANSSNIFFETDTAALQRTNENTFEIQKTIYQSSNYTLEVQNEYGTNDSKLAYSITSIDDQYPDITSTYIPDTVNFQFITIAGNIVDDYGFSRNTFYYKRENSEKFKAIALGVNKNSNDQSYFFNWNLDSLKLQEGEMLEFYVAVSDNDAVSGAKTTQSRKYLLQYPDTETIDNILDEKANSVKDKLDDTEENVQDLNEQLEEIEESLKVEQELSWQNEKQLRDAIQEKEDITQQLEELKQKNENLKQTSDQFKENSDRVKSKAEELQKLIEELKNDETQELYEKLKELLDEKSSADEIREQLEKIQKNERNLEKELERTLELFKRLQMETKLENTLQKLDSLSARQERLSENELNTEEERNEQEDINKEFDDLQKDLDEVEDMNQELKRPQPLEDFEMEERQIDKNLEEILEELNEQNAEQNEGAPNDQEQNDQANENQPSDQQEQGGQQQEQNEQGGEQQPSEKENGEQGDQENGEQSEGSQQQNEQSPNQPGQKQQSTQKKQKKASNQMKQLQQKMSKMQSGMQMEVMQANLDQLRDILDNLVKLSFNQEDLLKEMRTVNQSDPRFLELSQAQLKLKDDAKVIQDSLLSLAKQVVQISSFVTREVGAINENIDEAVDHLKDRDRSRALSAQQFAMTSINNLALLLDNTMQQMQMSMSESQGSGNQQNQQQMSIPDMEGMQEQLGQKIQQLKESGKGGRELSEELAKLAAEQEMIRRQLEELRQSMNGKPGGSEAGDELDEAIRQMERNEVDLVNKRLTQQLINRQQQIMTRLLEAEKAQKEQDENEQREAERPSVISREIPPEFEEYIKAKQKEKELLKSIPVELNPFYKKEVNDYFRRISSEEPK